MIDHVPAEGVAFQLILAGVEDDVLAVGVHQQIAVGGANRAVADCHFLLLEGGGLDCVCRSAAMALGIVRDQFGLLLVGRHGCGRVDEVGSGRFSVSDCIGTALRPSLQVLCCTRRSSSPVQV